MAAGPQTVNIVILGTLDTKLAEFLYLRSQILELNPSINVILIDVGRSSTTHDAITVSQPEVYRRSTHKNAENLQSMERSEVIATMLSGAKVVVNNLLADGKVHGVVSLGGSCGTSMASGVMRDLPLTMPKLLVSTVASGDTSWYVGESDITMMYSVVDIAGLNELLRSVIRNAAAAIVGMAVSYYHASSTTKKDAKRKKSVGITMFGVTTPAADKARRWLEGQGFEVCVFHATGSGGRAMERLIREHRLDGVLDLTTTELADELVGGVMSAGEDRLKAAATEGIPQVVSVGALDMVNFGPVHSVPKHLQHRNIYEHNPSVTLVRTTPDECEELGKRLATRLRNSCQRPKLTEVWLPLRGVSIISVEGQPFYDKKADEALFGAIKRELDGTDITVKEVDADINDPSFAEDLARRLSELLTEKGSQ
ncbi:hypothetical protein GGS20DRAFT_46318 [Poronia punctata]|nr:hypothetical protein GGS20DRAFT_46318 [Poronia punctata]